MNRLDRIGIAFAILSIVFCVFGFSRLQSNTEDVLQWLPDQSKVRQQYDFFQQRFGSDDFLIVTWKGCQVDDPRLGSFSRHLRDNDAQRLIQSVANGAEVAERLARDLKLSRKQTARRLQGIFLGSEDADLTCVFVELSIHGTANRNESMKLIWEAIAAVPGLERHDVTLGGYPYIATYIDGQLRNSFRYFLLPSVLLATLVSLLCLRNLTLTLIVFVTAVGAGAVSIAFVPICGTKYGGLMAIIPALVFVLATSGSIHLIRYSLSGIGNTRKLLAIGWKPCAISTLTTAVGMLSLTRSSFPAIRNFGFFCAVGVCIALAFQLIMVPWLLGRFGAVGLRKLAARSGEARFWPGLIERIRQRKLLVSAACVLCMGLGIVGLTKLVAEVEVEKLFQPESEILTSLAEMEKQLGPMDQTELLVVFDHTDATCFPEHADLVRKIQVALAKLPQVGVTHSLVNFLPNEPRKSDARSFFQRSTYRSVLKRERDNLADGNMLSIVKDSETWRICLRFAFTEKSDFGKLARDVTETAAEILAVPGEFEFDRGPAPVDLYRQNAPVSLSPDHAFGRPVPEFSPRVCHHHPHPDFGSAFGFIGVDRDAPQCLSDAGCVWLVGVGRSTDRFGDCDDRLHCTGYRGRRHDSLFDSIPGFWWGVGQSERAHQEDDRAMWPRHAPYDDDWRRGVDRVLL